MPAATLRSLLLSSNSRPLSIQRLLDIAVSTIRSLGLAAVLQTRHSYRGGVQARRARDARTFLPLGLINARSITSKAARICDHILAVDLDVLAISETWLTVDHGDEDLWSLCPAGYTFVQSSRIGRRGGGVAIVFKDVITVGSSWSASDNKQVSSFEYISLPLYVNSVHIDLSVVYCPPSSNIGQFMDEFACFLEAVVISCGKVLFVGDFNIHVESKENSASQRFFALLDHFDLQQHVRGPTHIEGHTLDPSISRSSDRLVACCTASSLISDHLAVDAWIRTHWKIRARKTVSSDPSAGLTQICLLLIFLNFLSSWTRLLLLMVCWSNSTPDSPHFSINTLPSGKRLSRFDRTVYWEQKLLQLPRGRLVEQKEYGEAGAWSLTRKFSLVLVTSFPTLFRRQKPTATDNE